MDLTEYTPPTECGLALGLPLDRDSFIDGLSATSNRDFPKWYASSRGGSAREPASLWHGFWEREGRAIDTAARDVAGWGVEVVRDCKLRDFADLLARKTVVVVVGHWRTPFMRDPFDGHKLLEMMRATNAPALVRLRQVLAHPRTPSPRDDPAQDLRIRFREALRRVDLAAPDGHLDPNWESRADYLTNANVDLLEPELGTWPWSPRGLDLELGPHTASTIVRVLPQRFAGLIELAVCYSAYLGDCIKQARPRCRVIASKHEVSLLFRVALFREVIRSTQRSPEPFLTAQERIRKSLFKTP